MALALSRAQGLEGFFFSGVLNDKMNSLVFHRDLAGLIFPILLSISPVVVAKGSPFS